MISSGLLSIYSENQPLHQVKIIRQLTAGNGNEQLTQVIKGTQKARFFAVATVNAYP